MEINEAEESARKNIEAVFGRGGDRYTLRDLFKEMARDEVALTTFFERQLKQSRELWTLADKVGQRLDVHVPDEDAKAASHLDFPPLPEVGDMSSELLGRLVNAWFTEMFYAPLDYKLDCMVRGDIEEYRISAEQEETENPPA
ncbi:hypothetical protein [Streptomyces hydrogenans]|uniref:hypothetical protein n=1 Tax=Streptomyces hydrogenans TaxID=1873719 RepID=UPI0035E377A4